MYVVLSHDSAFNEVLFEDPLYSFSESSGLVDVCVVSSFSNNDASPITVTVFTTGDTAEGNTTA